MPSAVGQAPASEDGRAVAESLDEGGHQPRLADATDAEDREELTRLIRHRPLEGAPKERELTLPADHRRVEVACEPGRSRRDLDETERGHRIGLALRLQGLDRLGDHRIADECEGVFPQQDLAG